MIDLQQFETLLEAFNSEIEELPTGTVKSNLTEIYNRLYGIFEDLAIEDIITVVDEHKIMKARLTDLLPRDDKVYYRIKYNLDLGV